MVKKRETLEDTIKHTLTSNPELLNAFITNYIEKHLTIDYTDEGRSESGKQKIGLAIYIDNALVLKSDKRLYL